MNEKTIDFLRDFRKELFNDSTPDFNRRYYVEKLDKILGIAEQAGKVEGYTEQVYALARRCLWIAFVWNDHNFDAAHEEARKTASRFGITSFDGANEWLEREADIAKPTQPAATHACHCAISGQNKGICPHPVACRLTPPAPSSFNNVAATQMSCTFYHPKDWPCPVCYQAAPVSPSREVEALLEMWTRMARFYCGKRDRLSSAQVEVLEDCINDLRDALATVQENAS